MSLISRYLVVVGIVFCSATLTAQRQIDQGVWTLQGSASFASQSSEYSFNSSQDRSTLTLAPGGTLFLARGVELSGSLNYRHDSWTINSSFGSGLTGSSDDYGFQVGIRLYAATNDQIAPFAGLAGGLSWMKVSTQPNASPPVSTITAQVGLDYFLASTLALEPSLQYMRYHSPNSTITSFGVGIGVKYFVLGD